ncbi:zinc-binding dehydrogenase [Bacillus sp. ISL-51]|uniref:zinc-binding dehydrogenase n=1 Tax=Bacteria TaxID=2 RepID=UPI001BEAF2E9|nr:MULTISPECIES: zinc-binding dehydrogenase [Bacteria]MBT2575253.1 zinc-binding dehydrogenase [Bacillus sp. ISL-51]MBT2712888.1 zinc-binding dehydrogenase [Pseudomonas sp. ISL-88]
MNALIIHENGFDFRQVPDRQPGHGEVKVKLKTAGLNHRDLFLLEKHKKGDPEFILGSDGAGIITETGEGVPSHLLHKEVIINPVLNWKTIEKVPEVPDILGGPADGTFSPYVIIPAKNAVQKPARLSWQEAGVLPLSALTAYRALFTKGQLKKGEHLLLPGIGSGVATYALLMAKAIGAAVSVTSRNEQKKQAALTYGADRAIDSYGDWNGALKGEKADIILDSVGPALFQNYFDIIKPNGRIVTFGASSGDHIGFPIRSLFFPQINILGTSMGSSEEFAEMIEFIELHKIHPVIDRMYPLGQAAEAFTRMKQGQQFGNIGFVFDE